MDKQIKRFQEKTKASVRFEKDQVRQEEEKRLKETKEKKFQCALSQIHTSLCVFLSAYSHVSGTFNSPDGHKCGHKWHTLHNLTM